jgi:4-amino-4-deoxy-L-arabinose transferase-like glycosyltransferase
MLAVVWLSSLANRPLFNPDEGRYAEIPREMLSSGDWVIPHLNGLDYIEKPPLQYWATAISFYLFGQTEFAARLYMALTALSSIALVGFAGGRLWGQGSGWRASAVLTGMVMFVALGQLLTLDMSLSFYMTLSLVAFLLAQHEAQLASGANAESPRWMLLAWGAAALGVLTKGLVAAAIPAAVLVIYSALTRDAAIWRRLNLSWGLPLFLIITVPWHWKAAHRLSDFLQFFFVHEHFARYLTPIAERQEPWWFFSWVFLAGTVPWTVPSLRVLFLGWRAKTGPGQFNPKLFLWIWVAFILVFFSLSDSKLMPYILPAMPALALLIGELPPQTLTRDFKITAILTVIAGVALLVASFNWGSVIESSDRSAIFMPLAVPLREVAAVLLVSGVFVWLTLSRDVTRAGVFLGVGWCLAILLVVRAATWVAPIYSGIDLAAAIPLNERDAPLYSVGTYDQSLTFYLRRTATLVRYRGELNYGLKKAPSAGIADIDDFLRLWSAQSSGFAVMDKDRFKDFKERGVPMHLVGQNVAQVVVSR